MKIRLLMVLAALIGLLAMSMPVFKSKTHITNQPEQMVNQISDNQPRDSEKK